MNAVESHPQRQEIIGKILDGISLRQIGATAKPPLHKDTLARFRLKMLATTTKNLRGTSPTAIAVKGLGSPEALPEHREAVKSEILTELSERRAKRAAREASAESAQQINPITGEVRHNMDHAALGRYDANGLRDIEFRAQLAGLLTETQTTNVMVAFMSIGFPGATVAAPSHVGAPQIIEAQAVEVEQLRG